MRKIDYNEAKERLQSRLHNKKVVSFFHDDAYVYCCYSEPKVRTADDMYLSRINLDTMKIDEAYAIEGIVDWKISPEVRSNEI